LFSTTKNDQPGGENHHPLCGIVYIFGSRTFSKREKERGEMEEGGRVKAH